MKSSDFELEVKKLQVEIQRLKRKLETETNGRIKAEKKLREKVSLRMEGFFLMRPVGVLRSCFPDRFGAPRQGQLAKSTRGYIKLFPAVIGYLSLQNLTDFSHAHLISVFHDRTDIHKSLSQKTYSPLIKPPQSDGKKRGVFATRTPHRPNGIALSLVNVTRVDLDKGILYIRGLDLIDNTPILDIKHYVPHVDRVEGDCFAPGWLLNSKFTPVEVEFSGEALVTLENSVRNGYLKFYARDELEEAKEAVEQILRLDPRGNIHGRGVFDIKSDGEKMKVANDIDLVTQNMLNAQESRLNRDEFYLRFDTLGITFSPNKQGERKIIVTAIRDLS